MKVTAGIVPPLSPPAPLCLSGGWSELHELRFKMVYGKMENENLPVVSGPHPEQSEKNDLPAAGQEGHLEATSFTPFPDAEEPDDSPVAPFSGDFRRLLGCGG